MMTSHHEYNVRLDCNPSWLWKEQTNKQTFFTRRKRWPAAEKKKQTRVYYGPEIKCLIVTNSTQFEAEQ